MAQQFIVRDLLTAVGLGNEFDYARRGAGGEKAMIRDVCQQTEAGYRHWQTADIESCFASLKPGHLGWLPVPKTLLRSVVFQPSCTRVRFAVRGGGLGHLMSQARSDNPSGQPSINSVEVLRSMGDRVRRELPQGSVLSPLVARAFVGRELRAVLGNTKVARYAFVDNLTLGARSRPEVEEAFDALRRRLSGHPAGPIYLHVDRPSCTSQGRIQVFGYVLKPGRGAGDNFVHVCPGRERFDRFHKKLYARWKAEGKPLEFEELDAFVRSRLAAWMPSQQAWTVVPVYSEDLASTVAFIYVCDEDRKEFKKLNVDQA
jgi:hypothetical protein